MASVEKAEVGTKVKVVPRPGDKEQAMVVGETCDENRGGWLCVTHPVGFMNQWDKDAHIKTGNHVLAWVCAFHGLEQP